MPVQHWSEKIWVVTVTEDLEFSEEIECLQIELASMMDMPNVVVDLSGMRSINSSNLSLLLKLRKQLIEGERKLRIVSPPDSIWVVFLSTALDKVFSFKETIATALAELQMLENK